MIVIDSDGVRLSESCGECFAGFGGLCGVAPSEADGLCPSNGGKPDWCPVREIIPAQWVLKGEGPMKQIQCSGCGHMTIHAENWPYPTYCSRCGSIMLHPEEEQDSPEGGGQDG